MYSKTNLNFIRYFFANNRVAGMGGLALVFVFIFAAAALNLGLFAQGPTDGAFHGMVQDKDTHTGIVGAKIRFRNRETGEQAATTTGSGGSFSKTALRPGLWDIEVSATDYVTKTTPQNLNVMDYYDVNPVPFLLEKVKQPAATVTTPVRHADPGVVTPTTTPVPIPIAVVQESVGNEESISLSTRRSGTFDSRAVAGLPLGGKTITRSFDELALLVPGVTLPPLTIGNGSGPGVGAGVGSAGQFSVNGMRSRSNNFTVDGSDNNDADIGVRRQGFFSLVPQPVESIQEYQITTLLAPAEYGRNFGAQVNAVSKSGGNMLHGTVFGFLNSSQLNSREFFDTTNGNGTISLTARTVFNGTTFNQAVTLNGNPLRVTNQSGGKDSFTIAQGGFVLGGPIKKDKTFFFVSLEPQVLNATKEASFAVPTVEQRGVFGTGATGIYADCLSPGAVGFNLSNCNLANVSNFFPEFGYPTTIRGDAIFSLFPFANNPNGDYGANTYTERLPNSARGVVASAKIDHNFSFREIQNSLTARYNITQDWRDLPVTGGALFSTIKPRVRTQNFSTILNSGITSTISNVLRVSYGRTRLVFDEVRDPFLKSSQISPNVPFLLNAPLLFNNTLNPLPVVGGSFGFRGVPNTGPVLYVTGGTTECGALTTAVCAAGNVLNPALGRVGQINIAGFSPIGVDVNNFPQNRVNNTYQVADALSYRVGRHSIAAGLDIRRIDLNSNLPRNSRTLLSFNGAPELDFSGNTLRPTGNFLSGLDLAATGTPSGAFLSLLRSGSSAIGLRYYESDFFGQDTWRIRSDLSINFGLRYEYNRPPKERNNLIERTFNDPLGNNLNAAGLKPFIAGRTQIFDSDRNNFEPRVGLAWAPRWFGSNRSSVLRVGFGLFHDQILGSVVSQSRNVFPNFVNVNSSGFTDALGFLTYFNPSSGGINIGPTFFPLVQPGTLSNLNPALSLALVLDCFAGNATNTCTNGFVNGLFSTLPSRFLKTPSAAQYSVAFEQQLTSNMFVSAAYIGTRGYNLLRASTPNLGANNIVVPFSSFAGADDANCFPVITAACTGLQPRFSGVLVPPGLNANTGTGGRPQPNAGPVFIYETAGISHYDAFQLQLRGRFFRNDLRYQANYMLAKSTDDASDVFDLAGSPALPQNSLTRAGELAPSNFDTRHRFSYNFIYDFPSKSNGSSFYHRVFGGMQISGTGYFQTGQPFTVNSIYDVNLDGNLTDRLNTTAGLNITGNRQQPLVIATGTILTNLIAKPGSNGAVGRNSFRAGNILNLDLAVMKNFLIQDRHKITIRMDMFNFINHANFGIPVRFLESPSFGQATDTVTPGRRIQLGLKYSF